MPAVPKNRTAHALNRTETRLPADAAHAGRLIELRDRLTNEIATSPPAAALAALGRELRSTLAELAALAPHDPREHRERLEALIARMRAAMDDETTSAAAVAALGREVRASIAEAATLPDPDAGPDLAEQLRERRRLRIDAARAARAAATDEASS